jgi:hypothetical protein
LIFERIFSSLFVNATRGVNEDAVPRLCRRRPGEGRCKRRAAQARSDVGDEPSLVVLVQIVVLLVLILLGLVRRRPLDGAPDAAAARGPLLCCCDGLSFIVVVIIIVVVVIVVAIFLALLSLLHRGFRRHRKRAAGRCAHADPLIIVMVGIIAGLCANNVRAQGNGTVPLG